MGIINSLFRKKGRKRGAIDSLFLKKSKGRGASNLDERIIWGIWAPRRLQLFFKTIAGELRVPISVVVHHALTQWAVDDYIDILDDKQKKLEFGDYLAKKYLSNEMED